MCGVAFVGSLGVVVVCVQNLPPTAHLVGTEISQPNECLSSECGLHRDEQEQAAGARIGWIKFVSCAGFTGVCF